MTMASLRLRFFRRTAPLVVSLGLLAGCNRTFYREAADLEVRVLVDEKSNDPRWDLQNFTIEIDPRSRYAELSDRDFPPMPPDDLPERPLVPALGAGEQIGVGRFPSRVIASWGSDHPHVLLRCGRTFFPMPVIFFGRRQQDGPRGCCLNVSRTRSFRQAIPRTSRSAAAGSGKM